MLRIVATIVFALLLPAAAFCQDDAFKPDYSNPLAIPGYRLAWHDEFNNTGKPDSTNWTYETGFVRNEELQWYQPANATCTNGVLLIEGKKERVTNHFFKAGSPDWRYNRPYAEYTSACVVTQGLQQFGYGRFEIRARIDTAQGAWPAIWTLGVNGQWPANGEVDQMEFYRVNGIPTILANVAWGTNKKYVAKWNTQRVPLAHFIQNDNHWVEKFHIWRMDWSKDSINLYLDNELLNTTLLSQTINEDGSNPFTKPQYLLLNLALGQNGGAPRTDFETIKYEVDYVRYYTPEQQ